MRYHKLLSNNKGDRRSGKSSDSKTVFCWLFEQAFKLQQRDANTKESKDTVLESDDFPLRRFLVV